MPNLFPWLPPALQDLMIDAAWETITMVFVSVLVAVAIGLPLALLLYSTGQGGLRPNGWINRPLGIDHTFTFLDESTLPYGPFEYITRQTQGDFTLQDEREGTLWMDAGIATSQADLAERLS